MQLIELFKFMIESKSVTPDDGGLLDFTEQYLSDFKAIRIDVEGVKNLFLYKKFADGEHLCFAGHVDVVPAGSAWNSDPYKAQEKDGYIYGRGAQDMKSGVAAFVKAVQDTKDFSGTLSIILTSDEEGDGIYGTKEVIKYLQVNSMLPDAVVVAEPTCEKMFGDAIKIGRRGSINGYITLKGKQGHAAYPEKSINPVNLIAPRLSNMAGIDLDNGDEFFSPSKFVITDIRAGMQVTNVTPNELKMMFNVRNTTLTSKDDVEKFVAKNLDGLDYELKLSQGSYPFMTSSDKKVVKNIDEAIKSITGIKPKYSTSGGTSDARYFAPLGVDVVEFGVINDTIHAVDERTSIAEVEGLYKVFKKLIDDWK